MLLLLLPPILLPLILELKVPRLAVWLNQDS